MSREQSHWEDGRRAWHRLYGRHEDHLHGAGQPADDGEEALAALSDIGVLRRLLDQAELAAVTTARRHRRSWAEIATELGVSRQSAWERWRDPEAADLADADRSSEDPAAPIVARTATRSSRSRSLVRVPDLAGLTWDEARDVLLQVGLLAFSGDPDGPPISADDQPGGTVVRQYPDAGIKVPPGTSVRLWVERGGGSAGVREPRRPSPTPVSAMAEMDEPVAGVG